MLDEINRLPQGDVLIHAGDLTGRGSQSEIFDAFANLARLPYERILVTPGNHDFGFEQNPFIVHILKNKFPHIEILLDLETTIDGLRIWASPYTPWFHDWAFNFLPGPAGIAQAQEKWATIPDDTAILITHGPRYGVLDETLQKKHVGCAALAERIASLPQLRLHVFGHIHESYGVEKVGDVLHVNACICDALYRPVQPPMVIDILNGEYRHVPFAEWTADTP